MSNEEQRIEFSIPAKGFTGRTLSMVHSVLKGVHDRQEQKRTEKYEAHIDREVERRLEAERIKAAVKARIDSQ